MKRYLSLGEAAEEVGVHPRTVRRWILAGLLRAVRPGAGRGRIRVSVEEWRRHLAARKVEEE